MSDTSVELIDFMGSDLSVVNAARVSMDKASQWNTTNLATYAGPEDKILHENDVKLIKYLAKHNHWTPFGHAFASFRIKAPIFIARQLGKHQVGLVWNEVSRRYVDSDPEFYEPSEWRAKAPNVKQGSSIDTVEDNVGICIEYTNAVKECYLTYKKMLDHGVCPEQARMILPQSMMTEWIWSGNLYAFSRVCNLRIDPHTQKETQVIAWKIDEYMERRFPVSWKELLNQKNELVI